MKAIVCEKYGPPRTLQLKEITKPSPAAKEVLIRVEATAINDFDWSFVRGKPYLYRLLFGLFKPKTPIPGLEYAGVVEAVGEGVSAFKAGDEVYGDLSDVGWGSFAEYIAIHEEAVVPKPQMMPFVEAASIPHASMLASQGLIDAGQIKEGQKVLINGAGGGMGMFALQIAKMYGAEISGVDSGAKLERMRAMGFDHVIDYQKEDFTRNGQRYDLILDAKTTRSPFAFLRSLQPNGKYVTVGGYVTRLIQHFFLKGWISRFTDKSMHIVALKPNKDLAYINQLYEAGKIKPHIDGPYALDEIPRLIQYFGEGRHQGKVVITLTSS